MISVLVSDGRFDPVVYYQEKLSPAFDWKQSQLPDNWIFLNSRIYRFFGARLFYSKNAIDQIRLKNYDIFVVGGYASITNQLVMRWLSKRQIPWIFWGEIPGYQKRGFLGAKLRKVAMLPALSQCSAVAAIGSLAADYYRRALSECVPVFNIPYYVDVEEFKKKNVSFKSITRHVIKILFCGQLVQRKGVDILVRVITRILKEGDSNISCCLLGRGELEESLKNAIPNSLKSHFSFVGFRQIEELPSFFGECDIFVLPSLHDGWGVVINQAMAAGLPIISTFAVGAAVDLVQQGKNGFLVEPGNEEDLYRALSNLIDSQEARVKFGLDSRMRIEQWTPNVEANRWFKMVSTVLNQTENSR